MARMHNPPHPGEVLREYLGSLIVSDVATHLSMSALALQGIVDGDADISADIAYRLGDAFGTSPEFWAGMPLEYDLYQAGKLQRPKIERLVPATSDLV
ncbi:HigA family addiction module antitoxin [Duganella sp. P38]|uniref:HigA family addiction module antitoxin n=1 Tax=Duganella sp. P38 TaxID=3423949 RepID=UPI003D7AD709